jgi:hypothetical protein
MLLFLTTPMSGMRHSLIAASHHPHRMAPLVTAMMVPFASYMLTSSLLKMVI